MTKEACVFALIYIGWCIVTMISNEIHYLYCQPKTMIGWLMFPLINNSSQCRIIEWIQYGARNTTSNLGFSCITYAMKTLTTTFPTFRLQQKENPVQSHTVLGTVSS
jgi:hypothetical protein